MFPNNSKRYSFYQQPRISRRAALAFLATSSLNAAERIKFPVPPNSCDCHTHIFGDYARFPLWAGRPYTPPPALPPEMAALHRTLHMQRVVIVTPSIYGTDNSSTIYGMRARGKDARGVAVIGSDTTEADLDKMHRDGFRGIRLNFAMSNVNDVKGAQSLLRDAIKRVERLGWHIQIFTTPKVIAGIAEVVDRSPIPVVFDHFAGAKAAPGMEQEGLREVLALVKSGRAYVKISGAYRASDKAPDYADAAPLAKAFIAANASRVIWGTDWPHPDSAPPKNGTAKDVTPLLKIDDLHLLNQLAVWAPESETRKAILADNPASLYGF